MHVLSKSETTTRESAYGECYADAREIGDDVHAAVFYVVVDAELEDELGCGVSLCLDVWPRTAVAERERTGYFQAGKSGSSFLYPFRIVHLWGTRLRASA
jgi:hypothetical protein